MGADGAYQSQSTPMKMSLVRTALARGRSSGPFAVVAVVTMSMGSASSAFSLPRENTSVAVDRDYPAAALSSLRGKIAYSPGVHAHSLWVMNADGSHRRQITHAGTHADYDPDWSPDGKNIVFRTERGRYDSNSTGAQGIFVVNTTTLRERQIQPRTGGLFPAWAPSGKRIAFTGLNPTCCGEVIVTSKPHGNDKRIVRPPT